MFFIDLSKFIRIGRAYPRVSSLFFSDSFGQLVRENNQALDKTFIYSYNNIGNITNVKAYAYTTAETPSGSYTQKAYAYHSTYPDRLITYGNKSISYNSLGCPVAYGNKLFSWTNGKLTRMYDNVDENSSSSSENVSFGYDAYGNRISKVYEYDPGPDYSGNFLVRSSVIYDYDHSGRLIRELHTEDFTESSSKTLEFIYLYDESGIIGTMYSYNGETAQPYYYRRNVQGDVIAIYDAGGNRKVEYAYDAFGNCTIINSSLYDLAHNNPIRYRGYYYDRQTNLYYLNSRYYSPEWCRFISPDDTSYLDPENPNGLNLYAYCYNDPVNYADPSGNLPQWAEWLIGGAIIGLAALGSIFLPGAAGVIMGATFYGAVTSAVGGAVLGGLNGGITGGWEGIWNGASKGFMWGAIFGSISGALTSGINIATSHLKIVGSAQKTGSLFHQFASNVQAGKMSLAIGRYSEIYLNRSKGLGIKGFRPDVTGITKKGLRVVEVVSTSQTYSSQVAKIGRMMRKYSNITNGVTLDAFHLITNWFIF